MVRTKLLLRIADLIEENVEKLGRLELLCTGKPMTQSKNFEVPMAANIFRCTIRKSCKKFHRLTSP
jgi:acyl-CoA reductase-like NAD-dependent aldehyde dehydrogenase